MTLTVLSICACGSDELSISIELSNGNNRSSEKFIISTAAYTQMRISKGECSIELYEKLEREAKIHSAYKRALYILGYGACSRKTLISKLIAKGFERDASEAAVERISELGFINDSSSALREAEICAAKLWGETRIRYSLLQKGYSRDDIDLALFALEDSGIDFAESCKKLIKSKYGTPPTERAAVQKMISALLRYGYSVSQIKSACADILDEE